MAGGPSDMRAFSLRGERRRLKLRREADELFKGHRYEFVREFHLRPDQVCYNPFGRTIQHGFVLRDLDTGELIAVGLKLIRKLAHVYKAIELPPRIARMRSRHSPRPERGLGHSERTSRVAQPCPTDDPLAH